MPGQQGPTQGRAYNGADHSTHTVPQSQLWSGDAMVQQEERKQAAGTLLTCGENVSRGSPPLFTRGFWCTPLVGPLPCLCPGP